MEKQQFKISISAPREKVWKVLWEKETYSQWTKPFSETSTAETDWQKGSKVLFGDGTGNGMVALIEENIPNEYMSIKHLGEMKNGVEDTTSDQVQQWAGAHENYTLKTSNGETELIIDMDITPEFAEMFNEAWPKALAKVKEISER